MWMELGVEGAALKAVLAFPINDVEVQLGVGYIEIANVHLPWTLDSILHKLLEYLRGKSSFERAVRAGSPRGYHGREITGGTNRTLGRTRGLVDKLSKIPLGALRPLWVVRAPGHQ
jgi:hypothetical protein